METDPLNRIQRGRNLDAVLQFNNLDKGRNLDAVLQFYNLETCISYRIIRLENVDLQFLTQEVQCNPLKNLNVVFQFLMMKK